MSESADDGPGTWDFRVRVTHADREMAEDMITGNALDDPFGHVTVEACHGRVDTERLSQANRHGGDDE